MNAVELAIPMFQRNPLADAETVKNQGRLARLESFFGPVPVFGVPRGFHHFLWVALDCLWDGPI